MEIDKIKLRHSFAGALYSYDKVAVLQRRVGLELLAFANIGRLTGRIMDLGCGTGFLTQKLLQLEPSLVIGVDMVLPMLQVSRDKLKNYHHVKYLCADAELLSIANDSLSYVFSNLALQWCQNLQGVFAELERVLEANGVLVFSIFGPQTLQELKAAWATVDDFEHVNEFYSEAQLNDFLQQAGFKEVRFERKILLANYDSPFALMSELKQLGAVNVLAGRNKNLTSKTSLQRMILAYERLRVAKQIPATFEIIKVCAKT